MKKLVKSLVSLMVVGMVVASSPTNVFASDIIKALDKHIVESQLNPVDVVAVGKYEVMVDGIKTVVPDVKTDSYKMSNKELVALTENELYHLYSSYEYVLEFGLSYANDTFYTYSGKELGLINFDKYVYSLLADCKSRGIENNKDVKELFAVYSESTSVRDCILNFTLVSSDFREEQLNKLSTSSWLKTMSDKYYFQ